MDVTNGLALLTTLATVKDPRRVKSTTHSLIDVLFTALCAAIAGCDTWSEVVAFAHERLGWLRKFVPLEHGVPSEDTFRRIFQMLDTGRFAACLLAWTRSMATTSAGIQTTAASAYFQTRSGHRGDWSRRTVDRRLGRSSVRVAVS